MGKLTTTFVSVGVIGLAIAWYTKHSTETFTTFHIAGDSTAATQLASRRPLTGWGESFVQMICPGARVVNHAINGRSSKSFIDEGLLQKMQSQLSEDDIVLIQFGHNDQKIKQNTLYSAPWKGYRENLERFVKTIRTAKAVPVLVTPIARRSFTDDGELINTHSEYPEVVRTVADDTGVKLIDLNTLTHRRIQAMGVEDSKTYFLHLEPNEHKNYKQGVVDDTHLSPIGANEIARLTATALQQWYPDHICIDEP